MKRRILFVTDPDKPDYYALITDRFRKRLWGARIEYLERTANQLGELNPADFDLAIFFLPDLAIKGSKDGNNLSPIFESWLTIPTINHPARIYGSTAKSTLYATYPDYCPKFWFYDRNENILFQNDVILRDNLYHGLPMFPVSADVAITSLHADTIGLHFPIWVEYVDTFDIPTQRYWKYRCMFLKNDNVDGDEVIPMHLQSSRKVVAEDEKTINVNAGNAVINPWIVRGDKRVQDEIECIAERDYLEHGISAKHTPIFCDIARKLGFDWITFDYSFKPDGFLIIWEVNALPYLHLIEPKPIAHHIVQTFAGRSGHRKLRNEHMLTVIDSWIHWMVRKI